MRRAMLLALTTMLLLVYPAHAQLFPPAAANQPTGANERVLIDATFRAIPPHDDAPCMLIDPGVLSVRLVSWDGTQPANVTTFRFQGYRGSDPIATIQLRVNAEETSTTVPVEGGLYCWALVVEAPVSANDGMAVRTNYVQVARLRMTHTAP